MNSAEQALENSNRSKYGDKENDQISQNYLISKERGDIWCSENVKRYLSRYTRPGSSKNGNHTDLLKARDYLQRMIEVSEINEIEVVENFKIT